MADMAEVTTSDPMELLAAGRRHLAVRDYTTAVGTLAQACEQLATRHGDQADQCAEPYLWYGKALLGLAREETALLGKIGTDKEGEDAEEDQDDEMEDGKEANGSEEAEPAQEEPQDQDGETEEGSSEKPTTSEGAKEDAVAAVTTAAAAFANGDAEADESVAELDEDDVENIQLAWEMFELSRKLLEARAAGGEPAARALLADAHLGLGEVALESETYDKAVADMEKCLEIQKELYKPEDRRIAETHYQIGLANSLASNFDASVAHFSSAADILEARIKQLEGERGEGGKLGGAGEGGQAPAAEISELRELLPEIREKIEDMKEYKAETIKRLRETLLPTNGQSSSSSGIGSGIVSSSSSGSSSSTLVARPAADISHLVKRKRAPSPAPLASPAKKPAPET